MYSKNCLVKIEVVLASIHTKKISDIQNNMKYIYQFIFEQKRKSLIFVKKTL
jgi:hypothetical protein